MGLSKLWSDKLLDSKMYMASTAHDISNHTFSRSI